MGAPRHHWGTRGDIEDHYGLEVDPTLLWDQKTVGDLAGTIETLLAAPKR